MCGLAGMFEKSKTGQSLINNSGAGILYSKVTDDKNLTDAIDSKRKMIQKNAVDNTAVGALTKLV